MNTNGYESVITVSRYRTEPPSERELVQAIHFNFVARSHSVITNECTEP